MKRALTPEEKKLAAVAAIVCGGLLGLWFFVIMPTRRALVAMKAQMDQASTRVREVEQIVGVARDIREGIAWLKEKHRRLALKFPLQEEVGLEAISDIARGMNIELVSVKPQPKAVFLDSESQKAEIDGKSCQKTTVSVILRASFRDLLRYLEALRVSAPVFVDVERLKVSREGAAPGSLDIVLDVNIYSLS